MVEYPPADVVSSALVFGARVSQPQNDLHWLVVARSGSAKERGKKGADYFFFSASASPSSSGFGLRMSSGSATASVAAPSAAAAGATSSSAFGAATTAIVCSASSVTSTPAGSFRSLMCSE